MGGSGTRSGRIFRSFFTFFGHSQFHSDRRYGFGVRRHILALCRILGLVSVIRFWGIRWISLEAANSTGANRGHEYLRAQCSLALGAGATSKHL